MNEKAVKKLKKKYTMEETNYTMENTAKGEKRILNKNSNQEMQVKKLNTEEAVYT